MTIRVAHLYPEYLNIYADRGNIAVLSNRAAWRGIELVVLPTYTAMLGLRRIVADRGFVRPYWERAA